MATRDIEKVLTVFQGIDGRDVDLATKYVNPDKYIEHNPYSADRGGSAFLDRGINGFWTGHHHDRRNEFHEETQT